MQISLSNPKQKSFEKQFDQINRELKSIDYSLNNNQIACAIAVLTNNAKHKRIFLTIPPGKGKSRVIAALIAYKAAFEEWKKFTILFSDAKLKEVDEHVYQKLNAWYDLAIELKVFDAR